MSVGYIRNGEYVKTAGLGTDVSVTTETIKYNVEQWTGRYANDGSSDKVYVMWLRSDTKKGSELSNDIVIGNVPDTLGTVYDIYGTTESDEALWPLNGAFDRSETVSTGWKSTVFVSRGNGTEETANETGGKYPVTWRFAGGNNNGNASRTFRVRVRIEYSKKDTGDNGEEETE